MAIHWDGSWAQSRRRTVEGAIERIERMLTRAHLSVQAVARDEEQRVRYVQYFNNASMTNLAHVQNVVQLMHERVTAGNQQVTMSYVPDEPTFDALNVGPLPDGVDMDGVEAFVLQQEVAPSVGLTLYIGPAFFTGNVYIPDAIDQRTGTGTILHELSHGVGGTDDHAYTWEADYRAVSADQRARNADSYRAYCQSFDQ